MSTPAKATTPPRRMTVSNVIKGKVEVPDRILIYGVEGIGKSTFAASAPSPIFIEPESDGTARLDTQRFPRPESWRDVLDAVESLTVDAHGFQTLVIDTLDAAEGLLWRHICERDRKASIEDYGYGKGYVAALDEWRAFLAVLEQLRRVKKMGIVLVAHSWIKTFKNPEGEDFDRYEMKLHNKAAGLLREWCDAVLFAHYETYSVKASDEKGVKAKGVSTGARVIHTQRSAAWDAKNRYSLPEMLPLNFDDYAGACRAHRPSDPDALRVSIAEKLEAIGDAELSAKVQAMIDKAKGDAAELAKVDNRLSATLRARKA
jgi:AAA domain-containing protein